MIGTSEALNLGIKLGMDPKILTNIINASSARCWSSDTYNPVPDILPHVPSSRNYTGGFGSALMEKDLNLAMDISNTVKANLPLGSTALQVYRLLLQQGYADKDFSVIYKFLSENK
jgi:3-hydroxyisobutyrate dehydrogenase